MACVADYINEVQRLCETYSAVLDSLMKDPNISQVWHMYCNPQLLRYNIILLTIGWCELEGLPLEGALLRHVAEPNRWATGERMEERSRSNDSLSWWAVIIIDCQ